MLGLMGPARMLAAVQSGSIDETSPIFDRPGMRDIVLAVLLTDVGGPELDDGLSAPGSMGWSRFLRTALSHGVLGTSPGRTKQHPNAQLRPDARGGPLSAHVHGLS